MNVKAICDTVAAEQKASKVLMEKLYRAYWLFVKEKILEMDFSRKLTEKEFEESKLSITIPHIGRLACTWKMYNEINNDLKRIKEIRKDNQDERDESKESETIV